MSSFAIARRILVIRGHKALIDADLASLYGVTTKRLNQQVNRNKKRFPPDFVFQLTRAERDEVVANCDHLGRLKYSPTMPYAFTEHGALMAASVLNTALAVQVSLYVVRAFVGLRDALGIGNSRRFSTRFASLFGRQCKETVEVSVLCGANRTG